MQVSYSINPRCIGKTSEGWKSARGWQFKQNVDLFELIEDVAITGYAINLCELIGGYRSGANVSSCWGIGIDIDNDPKGPLLTLEEARTHPIYSTATLCYPSASFGLPGKGERFRLIWLLPEGIEPAAAKRIQVELMQYTPGIDTSCKSAHNVWYGSRPGSEPFWVNVDTPFPYELHEARVAEYEANRPQKANHQVLGEDSQYDPLIDGAFRDWEADAVRLLKKIPPRGPSGSGTFEAARNSLLILLAKFGPKRTREVCRRADWYGQWDQDQVIDDLWAWLGENQSDEVLSWGSLVFYANNNS